MKKLIALITLALTTTNILAYDGIFFIAENVEKRIELFEMNRIICSTDGTEENLDYNKAQYNINTDMYYENNSIDIYNDNKLRLINFDIVEIYGDSYVYDGYDSTDPDEPYCFTGAQDSNILKVMEEGAEFSRSCYLESFMKAVGQNEVLCLSAPVFKKVLVIPKSTERVEEIVRDHCPTAVNSQGIIDENAALTCIEGVDYKNLAGGLNE